MLQIPYTTLEALLSAEDSDICEIFDLYSVEKQKKTLSYEHLTKATETANSNDEHKRISKYLRKITEFGSSLIEENNSKEKVLRIIRECTISSDYSKAYNELLSILTPEGLIRLMAALISHSSDIEDVVQSAFNVEDQMQNLFRGIPSLEIVVKDVLENDIRKSKLGDIPTEKLTGNEGRYVIQLKKRGSEEFFKLDFDTKVSKTIFMWFLLNPRKEFSKWELTRNYQEFVSLFGKCFPMHETNIVQSHKEDFFKGTWNHAKAAANRAVSNALNGYDDEGWYIIDYDKKTEKYSISLPSDFIKLPTGFK